MTNLPRFDRYAVYHPDNDTSTLLGSDLAELVSAIETLTSELEWLKDSIHSRVDWVQEQLSDHIRGGD